jgi:hypothetical protein
MHEELSGPELHHIMHTHHLHLAPVFREALSMQPLVTFGAYCSVSPPPLLCAADNAVGLFSFQVVF